MTTTAVPPAWARASDTVALRALARAFLAAEAVPNRARWAEQRCSDD
ncbi:hypothetical protein [Nocardia asteroides]